MIFTLKDKYVYEGIECEIAHINNGNAWLVPLQDEGYVDGKLILKGLVITKVNSKGIADNGKKILAISKLTCGAI